MDTPKFTGQAHNNGVAVPAGSRIEAYIGATLCGVASTRTGVFDGYIISIVGPDSRPGCDLGTTVTFRVNGRAAVETRINDGEGQRDPFDLTVR